MSNRAGVALGSNLGNRLENLQHARDCLATEATISNLRAAPVYQSVPVNCPPGSPDFFNTVVDFDYDGDPASLLTLTQLIQAKLGRTASAERNAPRIIDLDILFLGDQICQTDELEIPHPRIGIRRFVLKPLADLSPDLMLPGLTLPVRLLLEQLSEEDEPLVRLYESW
ncbi:2-amino-4-hydroxy-6-hydroxymethyldihydropteridine diphosphokinase [Luteolibacter pohnpeiensis]|uniref:2-amino-4-hydroxy-6-hydroxymethyldihydropteridine pyrophosphokinase n=1 Tax=Luteolibacter pohnpeiensis TaxID=454153 RepID=A0A934S8G6_9BACT|nr:2-amino-4-hydroxy-6-hydroxymethyldihydropteridine diphosphokinase [Luteolibacter pohnpeiensis]MBK1881622.1 2-amino-4-hydroxy-6-hydroxymethyldihydropteridine diphosphokinase [Luteolibacter pohnpeiensis]